ncbi:aromatic acid exporter family protein [Fundicoccus culcitae]|uniref:Aromatic acid exporter family protein n=1 Tax=Fundicoccus culcitae TaxID=2969821 RepID=A0ABY5P4C7_9LACT|nr:aromatic acid exporter family protein [Fundicoccus culcitae]UUX33587.1 aromatic acid exporter family protein [Fundicoccus culcitae]
MEVRNKTIKMVVAVVAAIYLAQFIGLENPMSTGIITILTLLDTRKASREISKMYLLGLVLAFIIATIIFLLFGFEVWAFGLYLLLFVPIAYRLKVSASIAPVSVLVTHFYIAESLAWTWHLNGILIMLLGSGAAMLANLWMPNQLPELQTKLVEVEDYFRQVLSLIHNRLLQKDMDAAEIKRALEAVETSIGKLRTLAMADYDNQLVNKDDYYIQYTAMRSRQLSILTRIVDSLQSLNLKTEQNQQLAQLFQLTAEEFDQSNSGIDLLAIIGDLYAFYRSSNLPATRQKFENRAILYHILTEFERFLEIKSNFYTQTSQ